MNRAKSAAALLAAAALATGLAGTAWAQASDRAAEQAKERAQQEYGQHREGQPGARPGRNTGREQQQMQQQMSPRHQQEAQAAVRNELKNEQVASAPPGGDFQPVSKLTSLPEFLPGLGSLYVSPKTMPLGPYLAYDRNKQLVSTIYMVPLSAMQNKKEFGQLASTDQKVDHVDVTFNAGHPGLEQPHYHIIMWHVTAERAASLR